MPTPNPEKPSIPFPSVQQWDEKEWEKLLEELGWCWCNEKDRIDRILSDARDNGFILLEDVAEIPVLAEKHGLITMPKDGPLAQILQAIGIQLAAYSEREPNFLVLGRKQEK